MYVGIEDSEEEEFIAYAYKCMAINDRPSVGVVIFNTLYMEIADGKHHLNEELGDIVVHEIFHILGFNIESIPYFHKANYDSEDNKYMLNHLNVETIRGLETYVLSSPNVLAETKRHFNCPTATGM